MTRDTLYGSADWALPDAIANAGLHASGGLYFGETAAGNALYLDGDMPLITFAGSGSGKGRDVILHNILEYAGHLFVNDPKGELAAVSLHSQHLQDKQAYCINPFAMHVGAPWFLPQHAVNPLDVLQPDSPSLVADCGLIMEMMIPNAKHGSDPYFSEKPREWGQVLLVWMVRRFGSVTLPDFYARVSAIYSDEKAWDDICRQMAEFPNIVIQRVAGEIASKRKEAPKEFSGIIGTLFQGMKFIGDDAINACLKGGDFSLSVVTSEIQPVNVYLIFPPDFAEQYAPFLRMMIGIAGIYKQRATESPPVVFLIDEAAQLGYFEVLKRAYSFQRGGGVRVWAFFQDMGQIDGLYGREGGRSMVSSAQLRQFFGVRDLDTAKYVSEMCGAATVFYDDPFVQEQHNTQGMGILLQGAHDPAAMLQATYHFQMAEEKSIARRDLITPDEVLGLPPDEQVAFVGDRSLRPLRAKKRHYYDREDFAGRFLPNPYHKPYDKIDVRHKGKVVSCPVVSKPVPHDLAHLPQYQQGQMSVVELPSGSGETRRPWWKRIF
ncbi:MAG: type IV secretory system conjugative DNA transfer family protein [Gallionellaceae bacterium]|jgi:type IV secretion system protein VirD4